MTDLQITTFVPQTSDNERMLLARILAKSTSPRVAGSGLTSASRTVTTSTQSQSPGPYKSITAILNITSAGAAGGLTLAIQAQDPAGNWFTLAQDVAARTTFFNTTLQVSSIPIQQGSAAIPGNPAINGRSWDIQAWTALRATVTHSTADAYTYNLSLIFS